MRNNPDGEVRAGRDVYPVHAEPVEDVELQARVTEAYRAKYGKIQRLDRILRAEGDDPDRYKLAKQADTVMLFYLFSEDELARLLRQLGYEAGPDTARKNIEYYDRVPRTARR